MAKKTSKIVGRIVVTAARGNFDWVLTEDVNALLAAHDAHITGKNGRPKLDLEVFKRAALIMIVTGWAR